MNHAQLPFRVEQRKKGLKIVGFASQTGRSFTLHRASTGFKLDGVNWKGSRIRKLLTAPLLDDAIHQATALLYPDQHQSTTGNARTHFTIPEAMALTIKARGGSPEHQKHQAQFARYFSEWAVHRTLLDWHDLRPDHLNEYVEELMARELSKCTIAHYLEPVRATSRHLNANWPDTFRDIAKGYRLPLHRLEDTTYREDRGNPVLSLTQVLDLLDWLHDHQHRNVLRPAIMLQGVMGLQLREAIRLQWSDVDLQEGTITIQGEVKNSARVRRLPLPQIVLNELRQASVKDGHVVPYPGNDNAYGKLLKRALLQWNPDCGIAPKDLRNTLQTHAIDEGWNFKLVERFVGHAPATIADRHYYGNQPRRLLELFRREIIAPLNALVKSHQKGKKKTTNPQSPLDQTAPSVDLTDFNVLTN
jgi:integrase